VTSLAWLPAAIPAIAATAVKVVPALVTGSSEHRLERQLRRHIELLATLPEGTDKDQLTRLIDREIAVIVRRNEERLRRRIDPMSVVAMVVVLIVTTALVVLLWWPHPANHTLDVTLNIAAVIVGIVGFVFATVGGIGNLYVKEGAEREAGTQHAIPDSDAETARPRPQEA
jgi:K+-sensing histidine kinase KdpD